MKCWASTIVLDLDNVVGDIEMRVNFFAICFDLDFDAFRSSFLGVKEVKEIDSEEDVVIITQSNF